MKQLIICTLLTLALLYAANEGMVRSLCNDWESHTASERLEMNLTAAECGISYGD